MKLFTKSSSEISVVDDKMHFFGDIFSRSVFADTALLKQCKQTLS